MPKLSVKSNQPPSPTRRKASSSSSVEQQRKEKGRSRNACDRCKQKKVKCDGEGVRVCSICREGDFQCNYAQKPHDEKRQYRKGYVEMVEEANDYYKKGLHELYKKFADEEIFRNLRGWHATGSEPTVQEIIGALGVPSSNRPHEGGTDNITAYLARQNKPMLIRRGEWDREESYLSQQQPSPSPSEEMEMESATDSSSPGPAYSTTSPIKREFDTAFADLPASPFSPIIQLQSKDPSSSLRGPSFASSQSHHSDVSSQRWASDSSSHGTPVLPLTPLIPSSQLHPQEFQPQIQQPAGGFSNFEHFFTHMQTCSPCADQHQSGSTAAALSSFPMESQADFGQNEDDSSKLFFPQTQAGFPTVCLADLEVFDPNSLSGATEFRDLTASMDKSGHFGGHSAAWFAPRRAAVRRRETAI